MIVFVSCLLSVCLRMRKRERKNKHKFLSVYFRSPNQTNFFGFRPGSRSASVAPGTAKGPWGERHLAALGHATSSVARRTHAHADGGDPLLDAAIPMSSVAGAGKGSDDSAEEGRIAKLNAAEARIKARMETTASSYD